MRVTLLDGASDVVKIASEVLEGLISRMGVSAVVNIRHAHREDVGGPVFDIDGDDSGLLIGRRGESLRALYFLTSFITSRRLGERVTMLLDVAGYQERRNLALTNLAQRVAQRVASTGRSITLEPMPPNERRVIHMALADRSDVSTESTGFGEARQITVQPSTE